MKRTLSAGAIGAATYLGYRTLQSRRALDLRGKVALVTGGSRGLGFAIAQELAANGARIAICARTAVPLERARVRLEADGAEVLALPCDVTDREQVKRLVSRVIDRFGRLDILVNNAGIIMVGPLENQTLADFDEAMASMFWGPIYLVFQVLPHMRARRSGYIVNVTSIGGKVSVPHLLPYASAKFAAVGFSEGLHAEVAKDGIHVTTVVPGLMRTGSDRNAFFKGQHRAEFTLFSLLANFPLTSISATAAAHQIVQALRHGEAEVILSWQATMMARLHGLAPGLTCRVMALSNWFLPGAGVSDARHTGVESQTALSESFLTQLGRRAAEQFNQQLGSD